MERVVVNKINHNLNIFPKNKGQIIISILTIATLLTITIVVLVIKGDKETITKREDMEKTVTEKKTEESILYEPEQRISVSLPFAPEDDAIGLNPMGETIYHPVAGHPGIDFGWKHNAPIRASADGLIVTISYNADTPDSGDYSVTIKSGQYFILTGGLELIAEGIREEVKVKKDDIIGYPGAKKDSNYSIHWEMKPAYEFAERLCPMTYFDNSSKERIEKIWSQPTAWAYRDQSPNICSGRFENINSFQDIISWINSPEGIEHDRQLREYKSNTNQ